MPATLKEPGAHTAAVAFVDATGHAYPALQFPTQPGDATPDTLPNRPAGHTPEQAAVVKPEVAPNKPALQLVQVPAPARLKVPGGHTVAVGDTDPAPHAYPAVQFPEHAGVVRPSEPPNTPGGQRAVQALVFRPWDDPNNPGLQLVHPPAPLRL
jgi:hypothetical protein